MSFYEQLLKPLFFRIDPETIHHLAMFGLSNGEAFLKPFKPVFDPKLERTVFGLKFPHPVGLAAGFDKNLVALSAWEALGFGSIEGGTVTAKAQPGNPKPRIFRFPTQQALVNRLGFNNDGADAVAARLESRKKNNHWPSIPIGINLGKSKVTPLEEATADYLYSFRRLFSYGDYFVLNVSSPNTPGLRSLQDRDAMDTLLKVIQSENRMQTTPKPLLVKIAPDLEFSQIEEILGLIDTHGAAGIIATNTTLDHSSLPSGSDQQGGLSGCPLQKRSTEIIRFIAGRTSVPIIGVGGIFDADSAIEKLDAGASLVQLYTGFVYRGPALIKEICTRLSKR